MATKKKTTPKRRKRRFTRKGLGGPPSAKKKGKLGLVLGGLAALAVGYMGYKRFFPTTPAITTTTGGALPYTGTTTGGATSTTLPAGAFPIKLGDKSQLVKNMQTALIKFGGTIATAITSTGGADGIFGNGTKQALNIAGYMTGEISQTQYNDILKGIKNV